MKHAEISSNYTQYLLDVTPFSKLLGMTVKDIAHSEQSLTLRLPYRDDLGRVQGMKQFHGGAISALIDTAASFIVSLEIGGGAPTIDLRCDYLRPGSGEYLDAMAIIRRLGGSVAFVDVTVEDAKGRLVATGRGTIGTKV